MLARSFINHHLRCTIIILFTLSHDVDEKIGQEIIIIIILIYSLSYNLFFQNKHKFLSILCCLLQESPSNILSLAFDT